MTTQGRWWGLAERSALLWSLLCLLVVLGLRCIKGLDVTDEMQYYGQMAALARSGALFTTDLFIQQLVYLPFYPLLRGHWLLFGDVGLVLSGRLLLSVLLLGQFLYVQHWFRRRGSQAIHAVLIALCLTFVATYHGIFAISYNSMSQVAWVVFCLWFMDSHLAHPWRWAALIVLTAFAHPAAAVAMSCLVLVRWGHARQMGQVWRWFGWMVGFGLVALCLTLSFTSLASLHQSLAFSSGFAVGNALWSQPSQWRLALAYPALLMLTGVQFFQMPATRIRWLVLLLSLCLLYGIRHLCVKHLAYGYTGELTRLGLWLVVIGGIWATAVRDRTLVGRGISSWGLRSALAVQFLVLTLTSSNGLGQGVGGVMVAVPLLLGLASLSAVPASAKQGGHGLTWVLTLVLLLYVTHWSHCPYRDQRWYQLAGGGSDVAAFKYIDVSASTQTLLNETRGAFLRDVAGKSVWIASELPALYFALKVHPSSCMLYMHSVGGASSEQALQACLATRSPEVIIDIHPSGPLSDGQQAVRGLVDRIIKREGMICKVGNLPLGEDKALSVRFGQMPLVDRICTR